MPFDYSLLSYGLCDSNRAKMVVKQSERNWVDALSLPDFAPNDLIRQYLLGHLYAVFGDRLKTDPEACCQVDTFLRHTTGVQPPQNNMITGI
jgi:hypothetical protein